MNQSNAVLREATADDIESIAAYLAKHFKQSAEQWQRIMRHWWFDNPAFGDLDAMQLGWLLESDQHIVGFLGNIPTRFRIGEENIVVFNPTTWFVDLEHRGSPQSRELFLRFGQAADQSLSFITTPGGHVVRFYREVMGYQDFPDKPTEYASTVFDFAAALQLANSRKKRWLHAPFLPFYRWQQRRSRQTVEHGYSVIEVDAIGDQFDQLWGATQQQTMATHCRDAESLRWLMAGQTADTKTMFAAYSDTQLLGYGLFMQRGDLGRVVLECVDLWWNQNTEQHLLIPAAILQTVRQQYDNSQHNHPLALLKVPLFNDDVTQACALLGFDRNPLLNHHYMLRIGKNRHDSDDLNYSYLSGLHGDYLLF